MFNTLIIFNNLGEYFETEESSKNLVHTISNHLVSGGYFIGIFPDSSVIFKEVHRGGEKMQKVQKTKQYTYEILDNFSYFGTRWTFRLNGDPPLKETFLIHIPSFMKICDGEKLDCISISNLVDFYDGESKQSNCPLKPPHNKLDNELYATLGLFTMFVFKKK